MIDLRLAGIGTFATVQQLLSDDAESNAVITTTYGGAVSTVTLLGVSAAQLTEADFLLASSDAAYQDIQGTDNADDLFGGGGRDGLRGYAGDDRLFGEQGNDSLLGDAGDDQMFGGEGDDQFYAGAGADLLDGGEGRDYASYTLSSSAVVASLSSGGSAGDAAGDIYVSIENLTGSSYDDVLEGDDQANRINGWSGNDLILGTAGGDQIDGGGGVDYVSYAGAASGVSVGFGVGDVLTSIDGVIGSAFADALGGSYLADDLRGGAGDDLLQGNKGSDTLDGGEGSDSVVFAGLREEYHIAFEAATETYIVTDAREGSPDGTDRVRNVEVFVFADATIPAASILETNPSPVIEGDVGDNSLTGRAIADEMRGGSGNDTLAGLGSADTLDGGPGDDILDGGSSSDTASYASAVAAVSVSVAATGPQDTGGAGIDTLLSIENLTGSDFDDILTGDTGANVLFGLDGNDILVGGAGADVLDGGAGFDLVSFETATSSMHIDLGSGMITGDGRLDTLVSIEGVIGDRIIASNADERLIGGAGNDVIFASGGTDIVSGDADDDLFFDMGGIQRFDGGDGDDIVAYLAVPVELVVDPETFSYVNIGEGITADIADPSRNTGFAAGDTYTGIEQLIGSYVDDDLAGDEHDNTLRGSLGDDVIWGRGGNDLLEGDVGDDRLIGGAGADVLYGNIDFLGFVDLVGRIIGPIGDDIIGQIEDIVGDDNEFTAGDGLDVASYETATSGVVASLTDPTVNTGDAAGDTYILVEGLTGSAFDDTLIGTAGWGADGRNTLEGGGGDDTLVGFGGDDDYDGGAGNDTVVLSENRAAYSITYDAAVETFTLRSVSVSHVTAVETLQFADGTVSVASLLAGDNGDNSLIGTNNDDDISGGAGNDTLEGLGGNDRLDGSTGLDGSAGLDLASYAHAAAAVRVDLGTSGPQDTGGGGTDTLLSIEGIIGSAFDDTLIGNARNNVLSGGAGDDLLIGLVGDNTLDGGAGSDTVSYEGSRFSVTVDLALSSPQATFSDGGFSVARDTLSGIENVIGSGDGDTLKGDAAANRLTGGAGYDTLMGRMGDDVLDGGSLSDTASYADAAAGVTVDLGIAGPQETGEGADTLISIENLTGSAFADVLKGDSGTNHLSGGAGDDILVGRGGSFDVLDGGEGIDTASYADAASGLNLDLRTSSALFRIENLIGSAFADTLVGSDGANALSGNAGNDVLIGGLGRDALTGGAGADRFVFYDLAESASGAASRDVITDFQVGLDDVDLRVFHAPGSYVNFQFIGTRGFGGKEGQLRYETIDRPGTANDLTVVSGDIDGDRVADFEIELSGIVQLTKDDFLL